MSKKTGVCAVIVAALVLVAAGKVPSQDAGRWTVSRNTDPMTDAESVTATLTGENLRTGVNVVCENGRVASVTIVALPFLGAENRRPVTYRFDSKPAVQVFWRYGEAAALVPADQRDRFVAELRTSSRLRAELSTISFRPVPIDLDLEGADAVFASINQECGWS